MVWIGRKLGSPLLFRSFRRSSDLNFAPIWQRPLNGSKRALMRRAVFRPGELLRAAKNNFLFTFRSDFVRFFVIFREKSDGTRTKRRFSTANLRFIGVYRGKSIDLTEKFLWFENSKFFRKFLVFSPIFGVFRRNWMIFRPRLAISFSKNWKKLKFWIFFFRNFLRF